MDNDIDFENYDFGGSSEADSEEDEDSGIKEDSESDNGNSETDEVPEVEGDDSENDEEHEPGTSPPKKKMKVDVSFIKFLIIPSILEKYDLYLFSYFLFVF